MPAHPGTSSTCTGVLRQFGNLPSSRAFLLKHYACTRMLYIYRYISIDRYIYIYIYIWKSASGYHGKQTHDTKPSSTHVEDNIHQAEPESFNTGCSYTKVTINTAMSKTGKLSLKRRPASPFSGSGSRSLGTWGAPGCWT